MVVMLAGALDFEGGGVDTATIAKCLILVYAEACGMSRN